MKYPIACAAALLVAAATTGVAFGHAWLEEQAVPAGADVTLHLRVPVEKTASGNSQIVVYVPTGFTVQSCQQIPNWTCHVVPFGQGQFLVTWSRSGSPDKVDRFVFAAKSAAAPGAYPFKIYQTYDDTETVRWEGPPGSKEPAPVLTVGAPGSPIVSATPPASHAPRPATSRKPPQTHRPTIIPPSGGQGSGSPGTSPGPGAGSGTATATAGTGASPGTQPTGGTNATGSGSPTIAVSGPGSGGGGSAAPLVGLLAGLGAAGAGTAFFLRRRRTVPAEPAAE